MHTCAGELLPKLSRCLNGVSIYAKAMHVASDRVRTTRDLKGKTIGVDTDTKIFISMFAAYVGLNPEKDINWVSIPWGEWVPLFTKGKIDAFMCSPRTS